MKISLFNAERLNYGRPYTITVAGKRYTGTLFEGHRITTIYKKSLHAYGLRHPDDDWSEPATVSPGYPLVNFFGTFLTKKEIPISQETDIDGWEESPSVN